MNISNTTEAACDIGFFRATGIALAALTAIAGSITLTLTLQEGANTPQISLADAAKPAVMD
jgi:hypothetical protein